MAHQHSGRSGNWHEYPSSDGGGSTPSHPQLPQLLQGNTAPASSLSHPMAGGGQHQPGGVVAPDPSRWQYSMGGSYPTFGPQSQSSTVRAFFSQALSNQFHHSRFDIAQNAPQEPTLSQTIPHPTSSDPTTSQANHASGYHNPRHEDLAGVSHPIPQFNPRTAAAALSAYDYFRVPMAISQNAPQFPTTLTLTPFDSSTSLAAPTQSSSPALGACSPNDQGHLPPSGANDAVGRLNEKRPTKRKVARAHKQIKFITAKIPSASTQSTPNTSMLHIDSSLVDSVKDDATRLMILSLFQKSLYPATDDITTLANTALDEAITKHTDNEKELMAWKLWPEGQSALARLKGTVKQVHKNSQGCAWGIVIGTYRLFLPILFNEANEMAPLRKQEALVLLENVDHLDTMIQRVASDGQVVLVRVPFGNSAVLTIVEYVLVNQGYHQYISFDKPDWEFRLMNTIALSGAICDWVIREISGNGWFKNTDFHTPESEECYTRMRSRIASLVGSDLVEFRELLFLIRDILLLLLVLK